jgi:hypothetical protein
MQVATLDTLFMVASFFPFNDYKIINSQDRITQGEEFIKLDYWNTNLFNGGRCHHEIFMHGSLIHVSAQYRVTEHVN